MSDVDQRPKVLARVAAVNPPKGNKPAEEWTVPELLRALGAQMRLVTVALYVIAAVAVAQLLLVALWLFGAIKIALQT